MGKLQTVQGQALSEPLPVVSFFCACTNIETAHCISEIACPPNPDAGELLSPSMATHLLYLVLNWWMLESAFALGDSFSADVDSNIFTNLLDENLLHANEWATCSNENSGQASKLRARDALCPPDPLAPTPFVPKWPALTDIEDAVDQDKEPDRPDNNFLYVTDALGFTTTSDEPIYYCAKYAKAQQLPVCGSGRLSDRSYSSSSFYNKIENCKPSKSTVNVVQILPGD